MKQLNGAILKRLIITNELGMHARPAARIAKLAARSVSGIWIIKDDKTADATSVLDILSLGCIKGDSIDIGIDNPADTDILKQICRFIENKFRE